MLYPPLTPSEFRTLSLICEAFLPGEDSAWRATVPERALGLLSSLPNPDDLSQLRQLLRLLEVPAANLALFGRPRAFARMTRVERESTLGGMAAHRLGLIRGGFQALKRLAATLYYADVDAHGRNPVWPSLGYPGPAVEAPSAAKPLRPLTFDADAEMDCDVVVVGSGAGGAVVAGELASAGYDVIVLEKGGYYDEADFDQREWPAIQKRYLYGGLLSTSDQGIGILAGSCLGGGTVINYTTSFRTPETIRREWAASSGLDLFQGEAFARALDGVSARLGVNRDHNLPSRRDELMARGLAALGWHADRMPRNVEGCTQDEVCGYCGFGCVRGAKRSMLKTYLAEAAASGARLVVECAVERVTLDRGRAGGVVARTRRGQRLSVRARAVVASAGAIETPALLLRSGLAGSVGRHLHLHPVTAVWGVFDEEVRPWTGTIQAMYSDQFANLDRGFGVKFETTGIHPLFLTYGTPWAGAAAFDAHMRRLPHVSPIGLLVRDRGEGRVRLGRTGSPVVDYAVSRYDQAHVRRGIQGAARVLLAAGARQLIATQNRPVVFRPGAGRSLDAWMRQLDAIGYGSNRTIYFSWHQMGTCRMGAGGEGSVVGETGEAHAVKGLFVADASLFPSASGVNPMITIAALAQIVSEGVKASVPRG